MTQLNSPIVSATLHIGTSTGPSVLSLASPPASGGTAISSGVLGSIFADFLFSAQRGETTLFLNIVTETNINGELGGPLFMDPIAGGANLLGTSMVPAVNSQGSGTGFIAMDGNILYYSITTHNLTSPITAMSLRGPASVFETNTSILPLTVTSDVGGNGSKMLDDKALAEIRLVDKWTLRYIYIILSDSVLNTTALIGVRQAESYE